MNYRLKDRELQRKLDEISDGDFSARLHKERELIKDSFQKEPRLHVLWFGEGSQFSAALYADMLEEVAEYDPHAWNKYPEVEPPEGVLMRVECNQMKTCLVFENGKWRYPSGESFENYEFAFPVKRFNAHGIRPFWRLQEDREHL